MSRGVKIADASGPGLSFSIYYQAIPKKLVKVDKLQTTFKGAEGTKIYSVKRKAIPNIYNSLSEK